MNELEITQVFDLFHEAYLECAGWAEHVEELTPNDEFQALSDCMEFMGKAWHLIKDLDLGQCGHDFWLTRNGHGTGFWDRDYPKPLADELTRISKEFGECTLEGAKYE